MTDREELRRLIDVIEKASGSVQLDQAIEDIKTFALRSLVQDAANGKKEPRVLDSGRHTNDLNPHKAVVRPFSAPI